VTPGDRVAIRQWGAAPKVGPLAVEERSHPSTIRSRPVREVFAPVQVSSVETVDVRDHHLRAVDGVKSTVRQAPQADVAATVGHLRTTVHRQCHSRVLVCRDEGMSGIKVDGRLSVADLGA
jgi:hypothetical protein